MQGTKAFVGAFVHARVQARSRARVRARVPVCSPVRTLVCALACSCVCALAFFAHSLLSVFRGKPLQGFKNKVPRKPIQENPEKKLPLILDLVYYKANITQEGVNMSKTAWTIVGVIEIILFAAMALYSALVGGCSTPLETVSGGVCYMKCYWAFKAATIVLVAGALCGVITLVSQSKEARRNCAVLSILICAAALIITSSLGVGVCGGSGMKCHTTALVLTIMGIVAIVLAVVQVLKCDPKVAELPKMEL